MTKRLRQHMNPLKMTALAPRQGVLPLPEDRPVEVELGCGDAQFIIALAQRNPEVHYVGLDIRDGFLDLARAGVEHHGLTNVLLEQSNLIVDADRLFSPGRVRRFYVNFPDPWFKERQHNRRWLSVDTLPHLIAALQAGGELFFQSDVWALALDALGLFESCELLQNTRGAWSFLRENPYGLASSREEAVLAGGGEVWRLLFTRRGS